MDDSLTPREGMQIVSPYLQQRRRNEPKVGEFLVVNLAGNIVRAKIERVIDFDLAEVRIETAPMGHNPEGVRKGDLIKARRGVGDHEIENWIAVTQRDIDQAIRERELQQAREAEAEEARQKEIQAIRDRDLAAQAPKKTTQRKPARQRKPAARRKAKA